MAKQKIPTKPGTAFGGGFYAGRFFIGTDAYALIVAPKTTEIESTPWNGSTKTIKGATSYCDGLANTMAMFKAGSDLAKKIRAMKIGGLGDWYLPSRLELLLAYHELANTKTFVNSGKEAFEKEWYWSSSQHAEHGDYAWFQDFGDGSQSSWLKGLSYRARAVRRLIIW